MYFFMDGKPFTLAPWQLEQAYREHNRVLLEEKAAGLLEAYLHDPANRDETVPSPLATYDPLHIDHLADRIAERFLMYRRDTLTDKAVWKRAIHQVLAERKKCFAALPEERECGPWLLRPLDSLLRLMWRSQYEMASVDFCLDETVTDALQMPFHVFFTWDDGLLYIHLKSPRSGLMYLLADGTQHTYSYEDFAAAVKELLKEDLKHMGRRFSKYLWVRTERQF